MPEPSEIAQAVTALRPTGQWFLVHSTISALVLWAYSGKEWATWPWPVQWIAYSWLPASIVVLVMVTMSGIASFFFELVNIRTKPPVAPKPPAPQ